MGELHAALLQGVVTAGTAAICWYLYRRYRRRDILWWSVAWSLYVLRIGAIVVFLTTRDLGWLFTHQVLTGLTALALLWAALTYSSAARWRGAFGPIVLFPLVWSYVAIYELRSFMLAAAPAVLFLSFATLWTAGIFLRHWWRSRSRGAGILGGVFLVWGIHHLDYPLLRAMGSWSPWGYYLDILFVLAMAIGITILVLEELDARTAELGRLSARMVRQHEEERRRVSRELHDQSAQVWAAVKMQLSLMRDEASPRDAARLERVLGLVDAGITSIRSVTTNLRPPLLDDLGLVPALRALTRAFGEETGLEVAFHAPSDVPAVDDDTGLALFRAAQEALSNAARHSGASQAEVHVELLPTVLALTVRDNGHGFNAAAPTATAPGTGTGLAGMRERVLALRGTMEVSSRLGGGSSVVVRVPVRA